MDISVVVPVFNGENSIEQLFNKIKEALGDKCIFECILVHDGGSSKSWEKIEILAANNKGLVKGYKLAQNYGQHNAIILGINISQGDFIVTLDDDLQHDPKYIPLLIEKQRQTGADVVYAYYNDIKQPFRRRIASQILRKLLVKQIHGISPFYSPYRLLKKKIGTSLVSAKRNYAFIDAIIAQFTTSTEAIEIEHNPRISGYSSYSDIKLLKHTFNILNSFSGLRKCNLIISLLLGAFSFALYCVSSSLYLFFGIISALLLGFWLLAFFYYRTGRRNSILPEVLISVG